MKTELFDFSGFLSNTALVTDQGETLTYGQLQEKADLVKQYLQKGKLAFCLCSNTVASILGYVSLVQEGVATLLLDAEKDKELIGNLLRIYKPNYVWAPEGNVFGKVLVSDGGYVLYGYSGTEISIHYDLALLLTTSGSTGSPKLVRLTQRNLVSNAESIAEYLHITPSERPVTTLPMYYSFGMSVINSHFIMGATLLLTQKTVLEKEFWDFVRNERATSIAGVPYTYEMLKRLRFFRMELPELKTMIQAGGKLNAAIAKEYIEFAKATSKKFIVMYGQTEAAPRMSYLPFEHALDKYASIGVAIPGGKFSLRDANNQEITMPDTDGELTYEGQNVCMGYAECIEDLAKGDENCGVLHTGDVARRDADGYYYITGRMKRFVKVWGNRVNLDAIEQMIKPITPDCACIGIDDNITIFITNVTYSDIIKNFLAEKTKLNARAFTVKIISEIPHKVSGKVDYSKLA
jgi:acyl-CoA synthetase (AMP-forming)/AMP-acid ligase II